MTASESFTNDLGSQAYISRAFGAAKVGDMAVQMISNKSTSSFSRLVGVCRRTSQVCALFVPAERDRGKEVDWKD